MIYKTLFEKMTDSASAAVVIGGEYKGCAMVYAGGEYFSEGELPQTLIKELSDKISAAKHSGVYGNVFIHKITARPAMHIFGAGHIAAALAPICVSLGFRVRIIDDRAELLDYDRFPAECELIHCGFDRLNADILPSDYVVIATHGHMHDMECAEAALKSGFFYAGMIGSRVKVGVMTERLIEKGYTPESIERINAPVGLMIGAQTPEEIAVSIAAQVIEKKYENPKDFIPQKLAELILSDKKYTLCVIIEKSGSCPRGTGSMMAVCADGRIVGTIGGGAAELEFIENASGLTDMETVEYDMAPSSGNPMVCGGRIKVLILKNR